MSAPSADLTRFGMRVEKRKMSAAPDSFPLFCLQINPENVRQLPSIPNVGHTAAARERDFFIRPSALSGATVMPHEAVTGKEQVLTASFTSTLTSSIVN